MTPWPRRVAVCAKAGSARRHTETRRRLDGAYRFADVPPGDYLVQASAPSLALRQPLRLTLHSGEQLVNLTWNVSLEKQEVTVDEHGGPTVNTDASANA